jgi:CRP-like cAMP-binding protein
MSEKVRKLKDDAARLIARGKLGEAADTYVKIVKTDPRDLTARQKLAEIYARMGKIKEAVVEYQSVAGSYAADGLLLKAIAVCKIILQIDPSHTETQHILAELSTKRRGEATAVEMPKAMSTALAPGQKRSASEIRGLPSTQLRPKSDVRPPSSKHAPIELPPADANPEPIENGGKLVAQPPTPPPAQWPPTHTAQSDLAAAVAARAAALVEVTKDDIAIEINVNSIEGAPVIVGSAQDDVSSTSGAPIEISLLSGEGAPVVMGVSASTEGAPLTNLPPDLPTGDDDMLAALAGFDQKAQPPPIPDEPAYASDEGPAVVGDDESDVIELTEPARVEIDKVPPIPLFSDLPKEAFIALTERMDLRVAARDDVLVQEGERGTSMFIIIQGKVVVKRRESDSAVETVLAELSDGTFFGEMALLSDTPRMASVVCADDTMLFEISRELLADITREYPSVGEVMKKFHKNRLITNLLKTSPIFQPFSAKDKKDLIEKFKSRAVDEGTFLITRERPGEGLYVVLSGRCEVFDSTTEGKEILLAELKEGDVFGEMSMLWHKKTCASVKAVTPCVVLRLPRESFNEVIMTHPQILEVLTALSERRQRQNQDLKAPDVATDYLV